MIKLTFTGDFAPSRSLLRSLEQGNRSTFFGGLESFLAEAELNVTNLECPIVRTPTPAAKYGPSLATDEAAAQLLLDGKINLATLANNHIMDHGRNGLLNTLSVLKANAISYVGAGPNNAEATSPLVKDLHGLKIGFLNFAENEFSNTHGDEPGAAPLDLAENAIQIRDLKKTTDVVIVLVHGGAELHEYPSPRFKKTLRFFAEMGADLVIAHHTHRYNGFEVYRNTPIFFGLGNFTFDHPGNTDRKWALGVLVAVHISSEKKIAFETIPFHQNLGRVGIDVLAGDELETFRKTEGEINSTIADDFLLAEKYDGFVQKVKSQYEHYLQPYTSRYLHKLYSMKVVPSFLNNRRKRMLYLNLIRCEAHRDVLIKILQ